MFLPGDVIRWTEDVEAYPQRDDRAKKKSRRGAKVEGVGIGERLVTAQVQRERSRPGFVCLAVLDGDITWEKRKGLARGRARKTRIDRALYKGRAKPQLWDHESARAEMVAELESTEQAPSVSTKRH